MSTQGAENIETKLNGLGVSSGIIFGKALCLERTGGAIFQTRLKSNVQLKAELRRLARAISGARSQLQSIKQRVEKALGEHHAYIIDAHLLMLEDKTLLQEIETIISTDMVNAEWAVKVVTDRLLRAYASIKDEYLRERGADIEDVMNRLQRVLSGQRIDDSNSLATNVILIAADLPPSHAAELDFKHILGFATETGGWTSHTAIIARSLGLPAVVGLQNALLTASTGDEVILDGTEGRLIVKPSAETVRHYEALQQSQNQSVGTLRKQTLEPAFTADGFTLTLRANIEVTTDLEAVTRFGATGIGLYRSEFLLLHHNGAMPGEDQQFHEYRRIAEVIGGASATIRAFDLGGEKAPLEANEHEHNPALGLRGIRMLLREPDIFRTQVRALLRASHFGRLRFILPMVSDVSELRAARRLITEVKEELRAESIPFDNRLPVGMMIEVPAAVLCADALAREANFFSLGTNDLIQYLLAVDRGNEKVSSAYQPLHPAVLHAIKSVVTAAARANIPVEVCGEMAANPMQAAVLIGLGLHTLSLTPTTIPLIKRLIRSVNLQELGALTDEILVKCVTAQEVEEYLQRELPLRFPQFFAAWLN